MSKTILDALDYEIIHLLTENGRMSIGEMAKNLDVTAPTIRSRIKILEEKGLFTVSGLVDPNRHQGMITALVAMNIQSKGEMDKIMNDISQLPNVAWAAVVAGRYDIIAEVVCMGGMDELYKFTTATILKIGNVVRSETSIIMKSKQNWLQLPEGMRKPNQADQE
jgi:Lrp/AsnC family transcriptional regulator for asnA, asnC and gidA